jgi:hypothetical protein
MTLPFRWHFAHLRGTARDSKLSFETHRLEGT